MIADKLGYFRVSGAPAIVKANPAGFFGLSAVTAVATCTVYDGTSASGVILWTGALTAGQVVHFGGNGMAAGGGLFVSVAASETVNVLFT